MTKETREILEWFTENLPKYLDHNRSSGQTKTAMKSLEDNIGEIKITQKKHSEQILNRVTYKVFIWIIGILMAIWLSVSGYIVSQIKDVQDRTYEISNTVSEISGSLTK